MTDLKTKLAALHPNMTPGAWEVIGSDPSEGFDAVWIKTQPNPIMRGFTKEIGCVNGPQDRTMPDAEWIALTGSEANRAQIIAALDAVEECERLRDVVRVAARWFEQATINHEIAAEVSGPNENTAYVEAARRDKSRGQFLRAALEPRP